MLHVPTRSCYVPMHSANDFIQLFNCSYVIIRSVQPSREFCKSILCVFFCSFLFSSHALLRPGWIILRSAMISFSFVLLSYVLIRSVYVLIRSPSDFDKHCVIVMRSHTFRATLSQFSQNVIRSPTFVQPFRSFLKCDTFSTLQCQGAP